jgi:YVTN family beta-propeller protein
MLHREPPRRLACAPAVLNIALSVALNVALIGAAQLGSTAVHAAATYQVYVSNERSGDVTVINGRDFSIAATIPVGKRPRGIHVSPDGKTRSTPTAIRYSREKRAATMMMMRMPTKPRMASAS